MAIAFTMHAILIFFVLTKLSSYFVFINNLSMKQRENYFESRFPAFPILIAKKTRNVITD